MQSNKLQLENKKLPQVFPKQGDAVYNFYDILAIAVSNSSKSADKPIDYLHLISEVIKEKIPDPNIILWLANKGLNIYDPELIGSIISMDEICFTYIRGTYDVPGRSQLAKSFENNLHYLIDVFAHWEYYVYAQLLRQKQQIV